MPDHHQQIRLGNSHQRTGRRRPALGTGAGREHHFNRRLTGSNRFDQRLQRRNADNDPPASLPSLDVRGATTQQQPAQHQGADRKPAALEIHRQRSPAALRAGFFVGGGFLGCAFFGFHHVDRDDRREAFAAQGALLTIADLQPESGLAERQLHLDLGRPVTEMDPGIGRRNDDSGLEAGRVDSNVEVAHAIVESAIANRLEAKAFVSLHANASTFSSVRGSETYYMSLDDQATDEASAALARLENEAVGETEEQTDLDLILYATDPQTYVDDTSWLDTFGQVWLRVLNYTGAGDPEWMVLFAGGLKVDFILTPVCKSASN